jgi:4-amino-4-deoxy-L-arabinose transferase-like glycosyltransferase
MDLIAQTEKPLHARGDSREAGWVESKHVLWALAGIFLLNLLLRVFYLRFDFVNGDEGVRAITAARMLEGARLYADVVTDKPPGTTFFYAAVFALFGRSMAAVHLAAALWNFATASVVYLIAARLWGRRAGLWAALFQVYFSTNYLTQDMMAANTELLMVLPYTASFYFYLRSSRSRPASGRDYQTLAYLLGAGVMAAVATLFKQVGVFLLVSFAAAELLSAYLATARASGLSRIMHAMRASVARLVLIAAGFAAALGLFALWLALTGAFAGFWRNAVLLNMFYISSVPRELWLKYMVGRTLGYVALNATLWWLAVWAAARTVRKLKNDNPQSAIDLAVVLWGVCSLGAVFAGGRFFGHYFIQALPAFCVLASRGVILVGERTGGARSVKRRLTAGLLAGFFLFSFVRFHQRTAVLAYETLTGTRTRFSESWGMTEREREAEVVSKYVSSRLGTGEPLYIWEYALDVYWRTGCRPASRYLSPYYITGMFPDATNAFASQDEPFWRESRANLIEDLKQSRPLLILDVYGNFLELPYTELVEFIQNNYRYETQTGPLPGRPFFVYRLKDAER